MDEYAAVLPGKDLCIWSGLLTALLPDFRRGLANTSGFNVGRCSRWVEVDRAGDGGLLAGFRTAFSRHSNFLGTPLGYAMRVWVGSRFLP